MEMSENETLLKLDGGLEVALGLRLPNEEELSVMAMSPEYPESMLLDDKDIELNMSGNYYLEHRKRLAPYMINQNPLGKCNCSALKGAMEQIRMHQGMPHENLSDCDAYMQINGQQDNGSALINAFRLAQQRGIAPRKLQVEGKEYTIPLDVFRKRDLSPAVLAAAEAQAARFKGWEWYRAPRKYDEFVRAVASALARRQPVVFAWHVGANSMRLNNGYVVTGNGKGNHATYFHGGKWVGGRDLIHPDCRNSWGPSQSPDYGRMGQSWGDMGYALFTMQQAFACNEWHDTYIVTGARPDFQDQFFATAA